MVQRLDTCPIFIHIPCGSSRIGPRTAPLRGDTNGSAPIEENGSQNSGHPPPDDTWHRSRTTGSDAATVAAPSTGGATVLWTLFAVLLVLWLLGLVSSYTLGGFIHVLLVIAVVILLIRLVQGRSVV